jgi:predicted esterase
MNMAFSQKDRITSRPKPLKTLGSTTTGLRKTGLETDRDGLLYVPETFNARKPSPMLIMLHGANGRANQAIGSIREFADQTGTIILVPESQERTWDLALGSYKNDIYFINEALSDVFALYQIDPKHIAIAGFSDGASYALSVGLTNGDLFTHIIAFSPGFSAPSEIRNTPQIFVLHGKNDRVLPVERCSRKLVAKLRSARLKVDYFEFDGGHTIPVDVGRLAFNWFLGLEPQGPQELLGPDV